MVYLAFIFHMHQPYYRNLLTQEAELPWVRLHGVKDYLDMVQMLKDFPGIKQTFNVVPSLFEQVEDYANGSTKDKFQEFTLKNSNELSGEDKLFLLQNFFSINKDKVIANFPRYLELYFKKERGIQLNNQDFLDLQVLFNLAWIDPSFRNSIPELKNIQNKGRFFSEADKVTILEKQLEILKQIIPAYRKAQVENNIEISVTPYYHPILPLLYNTNIAKEANRKTLLPKVEFAYPKDAAQQINSAVEFYKEKFGQMPQGMWPSEEAVSEHILPFIMQSGIKWIVTDEALLFRSLGKKKRDTKLLYQPHVIKRDGLQLTIVFRDRNLSDFIGFVYHGMPEADAVNNFIEHLQNIEKSFKGQNTLVTIAMDGENAWEYYRNDGHDFLNLLYQRIQESPFIKTTTISEYLKAFPAKSEIKRLSAGSWIYGEFGKWIGNPSKVKCWEWLADARKALEQTPEADSLAWKQMRVLEGSDWFWWAGEDPDGSFDRLYRMHLVNFYKLIKKDIPGYLTA
ncbi:MAG: glycoside hydrolase family 57 protein [Candidatus Omnitrophota bacterium]